MAAMTFPRPELFDLPAGVAYLNSAYMGPLPTVSVAAGRQGVKQKAQPWRIGVADFFDPIERARELFAGLVGGDADGVAMIPAVSYGMAIAARCLGPGPGDEVILLAQQFPSNVYVWRESGATVRTIERPEGDWTDAVCDAIGESTAVVTLPTCHWTDGTRIDLEAVRQAASAHGAALVVDGSQSVGAVPFDVEAVQPDFLVVPTYKWLLGPYSQAFIWVAPQHRSGPPIEHNWITRRNSDDFAGLVDYRDEFRDGARRFDVGQVSNFALTPITVASLELVTEWTPAATAAYAATLTASVAAQASEIGLDLVPEPFRSPHLTGIRPRRSRPARSICCAFCRGRAHLRTRHFDPGLGTRLQHS